MPLTVTLRTIIGIEADAVHASSCPPNSSNGTHRNAAGRRSDRSAPQPRRRCRNALEEEQRERVAAKLTALGTHVEDAARID
jgi:hypothetical protein